MLWFSVRKKWKKKFFCFCVNKFYDVIRIQKILSDLSKKNVCFEFLKKKTKKGSSFCFFLEVGWYFILNKKMKNWKNECLIRFLQKRLFLKVVKKMFCQEWKGVVKKYTVLKIIKKKFLQKMFVWIKDDQDSMTR